MAISTNLLILKIYCHLVLISGLVAVGVSVLMPWILRLSNNFLPRQISRCHVFRYSLDNINMYRVFIKYCVFSLKFCDFSELYQFCCSAGVLSYLPGLCTHTETEGKQRKAKVRNILKSSEKTQYLMNNLYIQSFCA